ncbi:U-box domain-containing protein 26-like [Cornus florida]|uniref:U-box domain-containing protein 26-like n=1 Tax=Cornus florida TaxID=4283 RepID=UPI00289E24D2|nr:U-box domain-containing protein 26-like [Cornus florida]
MNEAEMVIPYLFRCPISLDLFTDPVTLCTGQTYDRSSIEKWLAAGNLTCPVTMQKLHDLSIVPNHTLRHLIDQWLQIGNTLIDSDYFKIIDPDPSLAAVKHILEAHESTLETKLQTLEKILVLAQESPSRMSCLIQLGFLPLLLELVFGGQSQFHDNLQFVEQALVCVLKLLPFGNLQPLKILRNESKLARFLVLYDHGTMTMKTSLCHLVEAISTSSETKELCATLGQNHALLNRMVLLLHDNSEASQAGNRVVSALASLEANRESLVREGAIDGLITYILSAERRERSLAPMAMATLEVLLGLESAKEAVINHPNGVNALVKLVFRVSDHGGSESAVNALTIICHDSLRAREEAICAGVLTQLLLLLQSQCGGRTKTKARMLLKLLRTMWGEELRHV